MLSIHKSMNYGKSLIVLGLATLGLFLAPNSAKAFSLVNRTNFTDTDFENLTRSGQFSELFVAEGRIGDRGGNATYELSINNDVNQGAAPATQEQFDWGNGKLEDFSLEYTGSQVNYIVGGKTLTSTAFSGPVNDLFLRTYASNNSTATLNNLVLGGNQIGNLSSTATGTNTDTDYIEISDISAPFKITGQTALSWTGTAPSNSQLAYQIKVGSSRNTPSTTSVPEPGTVAAILLATVAGIGSSKRKKQASQM